METIGQVENRITEYLKEIKDIAGQLQEEFAEVSPRMGFIEAWTNAIAFRANEIKRIAPRLRGNASDRTEPHN